MEPVFDQESPEERELKKRISTARRIKILGAICLLTVVAKFFIKGPPPPKAPDHSNSATRISSAFLDTVPVTDRSRIAPEILAKLEAAKTESQVASANALPAKYMPPEPPVPLEHKEPAYQLAKKKTPKKSPPATEETDVSKRTLVLLRDGRYFRARSADRVGDEVRIVLDGAIHLSLPRRLILSISDNAMTWREPIPLSYVQLHPAPGMTVILRKTTAKRITISGDENDS